MYICFSLALMFLTLLMASCIDDAVVDEPTAKSDYFKARINLNCYAPEVDNGRKSRAESSVIASFRELKFANSVVMLFQADNMVLRAYKTVYFTSDFDFKSPVYVDFLLRNGLENVPMRVFVIASENHDCAEYYNSRLAGHVASGSTFDRVVNDFNEHPYSEYTLTGSQVNGAHEVLNGYYDACATGLSKNSYALATTDVISFPLERAYGSLSVVFSPAARAKFALQRVFLSNLALKKVMFPNLSAITYPSDNQMLFTALPSSIDWSAVTKGSFTFAAVDNGSVDMSNSVECGPVPLPLQPVKSSAASVIGDDDHETRPCIILQGTYRETGVEVFYRLDFAQGNTSETRELVDVMWNNRFLITISNVVAPGEATLQDAITSIGGKDKLQFSFEPVYSIILDSPQ